ncbi:MAG: hypothetical protein RI947_1284 [Candidatus Parcubacteria bacterium]|jgi:chemotaxis protein histidine kinase CheA
MTPFDTSAYKELYISTARDYLASMETHLQRLVGVRPDRELMDSVLIPAHSLKSQGYVMGYMLTGRLAAVLEKKLLELKNTQSLLLTDHDITVMLTAVHELRESLTNIERSSAEPDLTTIINTAEKQLGVTVPPII